MAHLLIAIAGSIVVLINAIFARIPTYRFSPVFLLPLIWGIWYLRRILDLRPLHYALFVGAILLHDLGAYGFYQASPLPISFDIIIHFYFAFAATFPLYRALLKHWRLDGWQAYLTTLLFMMGIGALHEIMEFMSYLLLGEQNGMLKPGTSYFFDSQRDLTNNLLGTLLAVLIIQLNRVAGRSQAD